MKTCDQGPRLYRDLASWWPLLSPVEDYQEEAEIYAQLLQAGNGPRRLLELGSGGGNNAYYMQDHFQLTLVDRSPAMLKVSQELNPRCRHVLGDMRDLSLDEVYDGIFIHDAISYITSPEEVQAVLKVARVHTEVGGLLLVVPDYFHETFCCHTGHGGVDSQDGRALRYLEWVYDPQPDDTTYVVDMAYLLRHGDGQTEVVQDRHLMGMFKSGDWLEWMRQAGFSARVLTLAQPAGCGYDSHALLGYRE